MKTYRTNCVNSTAQLIGSMVEETEQIAYEEFIAEVDPEELSRVFPFYEGSGLTLEDDYHVTYWRSCYDGKECVYVCHSAIEYVFTD